MGLPHTEVTKEFCWCAYTAKVLKLCQMLATTEHTVTLYAGPENEALAEHVQVVSHGDRHRWFDGPWPTDRVFDRWDPADPCWSEMAIAAVDAIRARIEPGDAVGITMGRCQQHIADAFPNHPILEVGVGYVGVLPQSFRCFESRAHQAYVHGWHRDDDGRHFDTVIQNSFDLDDLTRCEPSDYLLFLGRHTERKGLTVVQELARRYKVITAGQEGPLSGIPWRGVVTGREKAELIAGARALICATSYIEPFGGVAVEAQLSGVPCLTTDFGAFVETVPQGVAGYRCNTLGEFIWAVEHIDDLDRDAIADRARGLYSTEAVAPLYDEWLRRIELLNGDGWYDLTQAPAFANGSGGPDMHDTPAGHAA